ncbi:MAG: hypothetical protein J1G05_06540 [Clostridiales bacterium]|nr:hypothetical protein [Clostridiales bacterium]
MKKFLVIILSILIAIFCAGCDGFFTVPDESPDDPDPGITKPGVTDKDDAIVYKVTLIYNNEPFRPMEDMYAQWTGDDGVHNAKFNVFGIAEIKGLDGDYKVTLSNVPAGYTYDPNNHYADNDHPELMLEILKLNTLNSSASAGRDTDHPIIVKQLGTYRAKFSKNQTIYFWYSPLAAGNYSVESWVDVVANEVNPHLDKYISNSGGYVAFDEGVDGGGSYSSFSKNFRMEISISADQIVATDPTLGPMQGNGWLFGIYIDVVNDFLFPYDVDFTIKFESEYIETEPVYELVEPKGPFATDEWWAENPSGSTLQYVFEDTGKILTSSHPLGEIKLNPADGFYHFYNVQTQEYGKVVYAMIANDNPFLEAEGMGFTFPQIPLRFAGKSYFEFIATYAGYCDVKGVHPVNEELKEFLQDYAASQFLFDDGEGWAENLGYNSGEDNMWLFACCYYR